MYQWVGNNALGRHNNSSFSGRSLVGLSNYLHRVSFPLSSLDSQLKKKKSISQFYHFPSFSTDEYCDDCMFYIVLLRVKRQKHAFVYLVTFVCLFVCVCGYNSWANQSLCIILTESHHHIIPFVSFY